MSYDRASQIYQFQSDKCKKTFRVIERESYFTVMCSTPVSSSFDTSKQQSLTVACSYMYAGCILYYSHTSRPTIAVKNIKTSSYAGIVRLPRRKAYILAIPFMDNDTSGISFYVIRSFNLFICLSIQGKGELVDDLIASETNANYYLLKKITYPEITHTDFGIMLPPFIYEEYTHVGLIDNLTLIGTKLKPPVGVVLNGKIWVIPGARLNNFSNDKCVILYTDPTPSAVLTEIMGDLRIHSGYLYPSPLLGVFPVVIIEEIYSHIFRVPIWCTYSSTYGYDMMMRVYTYSRKALLTTRSIRPNIITACSS